MSPLWLLYSCFFQCFPILIRVSRIILNWFVTQGKSALQAIKCSKILGNKDTKIFVLILVMKNPLFIILLFLNTELQFSNTIAKLLLKQNKLLARSEAVFWSQPYQTWWCLCSLSLLLGEAPYLEVQIWIPIVGKKPLVFNI